MDIEKWNLNCTVWNVDHILVLEETWKSCRLDKSGVRNATKSRGKKRNSGFPGCQGLYWGKQLCQRKMIFVIVRGPGAENLVANCGIKIDSQHCCIACVAENLVAVLILEPISLWLCYTSHESFRYFLRTVLVVVSNLILGRNWEI